MPAPGSSSWISTAAISSRSRASRKSPGKKNPGVSSRHTGAGSMAPCRCALPASIPELALPFHSSVIEILDPPHARSLGLAQFLADLLDTAEDAHEVAARNLGDGAVRIAT